MSDFAAAVRGRRLDRGLSQSELAQRIGVSRKWISEFEAGKPTVEFALVMRVIEELGFSIDLGDDPSAAATTPASDPGVVDLDALLAEHRRR